MDRVLLKSEKLFNQRKQDENDTIVYVAHS